MNPFLLGALFCAAAIAGLFFFRFYRVSRDRFFLGFALAFWLLALQWGAMAALQLDDESRSWTYLLRLAAFLMIILAIVDKNRER
jgi:hypothetical protein